MAAPKTAIIDEPWDISTNLPKAQRWLAELQALDADGYDVGFYIIRAEAALAQAQEGGKIAAP